MLIRFQDAARKMLAVAASILGLVTVMWWSIVFYELIAGGYLSVFAAAQCGVWNSVICELAQSLCKQNHILGIKWYSPAVFWVSVCLTNVWLVVMSLAEN